MNRNIGGVHMDSSYDNDYFSLSNVNQNFTGIYYFNDREE